MCTCQMPTLKQPNAVSIAPYVRCRRHRTTSAMHRTVRAMRPHDALCPMLMIQEASHLWCYALASRLYVHSSRVLAHRTKRRDARSVWNLSEAYINRSVLSLACVYICVLKHAANLDSCLYILLVLILLSTQSTHLQVHAC